MKQTPHTPGPWFVRRQRKDFFVAAPTPHDHPYFGRTSDTEIMSDEDYPTKSADAEFIVLACNAHADLLAAAEAVEMWLQGNLEALQARYGRRLDDKDVLDIARAAIAKAKGE